MTKRSRENDAMIATSAAAIVGRLENQLPEVTRSVQQYVVTAVSELLGDGQLEDLLRDTVAGSIDTFFSAVRHDIPIDHLKSPTAALEYARRLAQRGVSADTLVRSYRLGHEAVLNMVFDEIQASTLKGQLGLEVLQHVTATSFRYVDWISQQLLVTYQDERDRWLANRNNMRTARVREVLGAAEVDVDTMTTAIGYPLRRFHFSVVLWCTESGRGDELTRMERFIHDLAESIGARESPLFIAADRVTAWAWIPLPADAASNAVTGIRSFAESRADAPWLAVGCPLPNVEGFRRSHRQARAVGAVAIASGSNAPRVTTASDPGLALTAQLGEDLEAASAWVGDVLGPLACATESDERLRDTLRVFLRAGSSYKAAADELHLHVNSLKYRVRRAVDRRGRPITDDRLDVEVALLLCHWFGAAVLRG